MPGSLKDAYELTEFGGYPHISSIPVDACITRSTETLAADIPLRTALIGKLTEVSPKDKRGICSDIRSSFAMERLPDKTSDGPVV